MPLVQYTKHQHKKQLTFGGAAHEFILGGEASLDLGDQLIGSGERLHQVLHVVALAADQATQMENDAASLITLPDNGDVGVLQRRQLLLVPLPLALKLLSNLLLKHKSLERIITLLLSAGKTDRHARSIVLLLIKHTSKAAVLTLVVLDLDLEVLGLLGKLLGEGLELEEL